MHVQEGKSKVDPVISYCRQPSVLNNLAGVESWKQLRGKDRKIVTLNKQRMQLDSILKKKSYKTVLQAVLQNCSSCLQLGSEVYVGQCKK